MMTGRVPSKASFFGMEPSAEAWTMPRTSEASRPLVRNRFHQSGNDTDNQTKDYAGRDA